jgi:hypothetical protein
MPVVEGDAIPSAELIELPGYGLAPQTTDREGFD